VLFVHGEINVQKADGCLQFRPSAACWPHRWNRQPTSALQWYEWSLAV